MSEQVKVDLEDLKNLLYFLGDKIDPVYKRETDNVIKEYIKEIEG